MTGQTRRNHFLSAAPSIADDFLHRSDIPFQWIELLNDQEAQTLAGVSAQMMDQLQILENVEISITRPRGTSNGRPRS